MATKKQIDKRTGIIAAVVAAIIAVGAVLFYLNNNGKDEATKVEETTDSVFDSTKDAAAEVPQAASDAVTHGDQNTTRPNHDGSTVNLDQK